jgi:MFS family permease
MLLFPAVLLLVQSEFSLSYAELGLLANAGLLCFGLGALPAGMLTDRIGATRVLTIWLLAGSLTCLGIGFSPGPWTLGAGLAVLGLCASLHHPAGSGVLVVLRQTLGTNVGRAFGRLGLLGNIGLAAAPVFAAAIGTRWGWRAAFWAGAIPGLLLAFPLWQYSQLDHQTEIPRPTLPLAERRTLRAAVTTPLLLLFGLETLMGFVFQGFSTFLPTYLAGHAGIDGLTAAQVQRGGSFASIALLAGGLGHLAAGRLMRSSRRAAMFLAIAGFNAFCLFGMGLTQGAPLLLFSSALSFSLFALSTMSNTFMAFQAPPSLGGTAFGITFALSFGVGSLASSSMGFVAQRFGLSVVFLVLGGVAIGGAALVGWFGLATRAWWGHAERTAAPSPQNSPVCRPGTAERRRR